MQVSEATACQALRGVPAQEVRGIEIIRHLMPELPTKYAMPVAYRWEGPSPGNIDVAQMLAAAYLDSLNEQLQESQRRMHEQDQITLGDVLKRHEREARFRRMAEDDQAAGVHTAT